MTDRQAPDKNERRVWAEIDLDRIAANYRLLHEAAGGADVMAVLKADAYGHGVVPIARRLADEGAAMIGVGDSAEALELRDAGIDAKILILGAILPGEAERVVSREIATCLHSFTRAAQLSEVAVAAGKMAPVHLMVDTGMGRLGVTPARAPELAREIAALPHLDLCGVATHYASASSPIPIQLERQYNDFSRVVASIRNAGVEPGIVHASNSACLFSPLREHFSMVRLGIGLFGINPGNLEETDRRLAPALALRSQIIFMKDFGKGAPIGYHKTWMTRRPTRIATLPIGYNDGLSWQLGNRAWVLIRGVRAPIVGAISMDYTTVDVTHVKDASVGDEVTIIGTDGDEEIRVEDVAAAARTIPYEVTCRLSKRVVRVHHNGQPR